MGYVIRRVMSMHLIRMSYFFRSPYLCSVIIKLRVIGPYKIRCYQVFPVETITVTPNPVIRRYEVAEAS